MIEPGDRIFDRITEAQGVVENGPIYNTKWAARYVEDINFLLKVLTAVARTEDIMGEFEVLEKTKCTT